MSNSYSCTVRSFGVTTVLFFLFIISILRPIIFWPTLPFEDVGLYKNATIQNLAARLKGVEQQLNTTTNGDTGSHKNETIQNPAARPEGVEQQLNNEVSDFNGCRKYTKLIHLLESNHNNETSLCAFYEYNPGRNLTLLKVANDLPYVHSHLQSITGAQQMAQQNNYSLVVYLAQKSDYHPGPAHFSKIKGIELALFTLNYPWVFFTDLDFTYRPRSSVSVQHTIDTAPPEASLIIQREHVICSCMHLWRNTNWTRDFLRQWWHLGVTKQCCPEHAYDQIAFQGLLANYTALGLPLTQRRFNKYGIAIRGSSNPNFYTTNNALVGAMWNFPRIQDPLFWHTGHQSWNNTVNMSAAFEFVEQLPT